MDFAGEVYATWVINVNEAGDDLTDLPPEKWTV